MVGGKGVGVNEEPTREEDDGVEQRRYHLFGRFRVMIHPRWGEGERRRRRWGCRGGNEGCKLIYGGSGSIPYGDGDS